MNGSEEFAIAKEPGPAGFTGDQIVACGDLWTALAAHPWVRSLADGTLPDAALIAWLQQCRLFCGQFRQTLMALRAWCPKPELDNLLARAADDARSERERLTAVVNTLGAEETEEPWPVCLGYGSYLRCCAQDGLANGLTAVVAVEYTYLDTWAAVLPVSPRGSRWRSWIETWAGDEARKHAEGLACVLNDLVAELSKKERDSLEIIFRTTSRWELASWEMCWKQQGWPLPNS